MLRATYYFDNYPIDANQTSKDYFISFLTLVYMYMYVY